MKPFLRVGWRARNFNVSANLRDAHTGLSSKFKASEPFPRNHKKRP
jgi:hypothetical protein